MRRYTKRRFYRKGKKGRIFRAKRRISRKAKSGNLQHFKLSFSQHMSWASVLAAGTNSGIKGSLQNPLYVVAVNGDTTPGTIPYNDVSSLAELFDSYRINGIKVTIVYDNNVLSYDTTSGGTTGIPTAYSFYDPDTAINEDLSGYSINDVVEYENSKIHTSRGKLVRYFKCPRYTQNYATGSSSATLQGGYFDMESSKAASTSYPMYGVWAISWAQIAPAAPASTTGFFVKVDAYMSVKNRK